MEWLDGLVPDGFWVDCVLPFLASNWLDFPVTEGLVGWWLAWGRSLSPEWLSCWTTALGGGLGRFRWEFKEEGATEVWQPLLLEDGAVAW